MQLKMKTAAPDRGSSSECEERYRWNKVGRTPTSLLAGAGGVYFFVCLKFPIKSG